MSLVVKLYRDPYDNGVNLFTKRSVEFDEGFTVFVGCNGSGKSTLMNMIQDFCREQKIPFINYDNTSDQIGNSFIIYGNDRKRAVATASLFSSEGEKIVINLKYQFEKIVALIKGEEFDENPFEKIFRDLSEEDDKAKEDKKRISKIVILFDACDSGMSIDNIIDLKNSIHQLITELKSINIETYVFTVANEYEMVAGENCCYVRNLKMLTFKDYDEYKKFVLKSRSEKDKRLEREYLKRKEEKDNET